MKDKAKDQQKNIDKPSKKGFLSGIKKFFKGDSDNKTETKVKGFKKEQGISVNQFIVETTNLDGNIPSKMKEAYLSHVQVNFDKVGIKKKYLKNPEFKKEVEKILHDHAEEELKNTQDTDDYEESKRSKSFIDRKDKITEESDEDDEDGKAGELKPADSNIKDSKGTVPPPPPPPPAPKGGMGGGPMPPPPPPKVEFKKVEIRQLNTGPSGNKDKRHSVQPMTLLEELQAAKLKPVTHKPKDNRPKEDTLESKLQVLLDARREELNKNCGSSGSEAESDNDSSDFD